MTPDQIKEALARAIGDAIIGKTATTGAREAAAAVMALVWPRKLVWGPDHDRRGFIAASRTGQQYASFDEGSPRWALALGGGSGYRYFPTPTLEAAQAAAQSHADAAHWGNTALADMPGGE